MTTREEVAAFGAGSSLVGILTHPARINLGRPAVLLVSGGLWPRAGPLRLLVRLGRRLAERGYLCLRFDFSGVGESAPRQDEVPRSRSDILETIQAMDFLEARFGIQTFVGLGICRGAWVCFATAAEDPRMIGLALVQPETLVGSQRQSAVWMEQASRPVFQSIGRLSSWMRLLRGQADYRSRLAMLLLQVRTRLGLAAIEDESDRVATVLALLSARGVRILFLFSPGQAGYRYLQTVLKSQKQFRQPLPGMSIEAVPQRGHGFITQDAQHALLDAAANFVGQCGIPAGDS